MKIVCNNCNAKYSIADEKVKGKVFKIRCKKCGESIVVRGDSPPEQASEPAPPPMPFGGSEEEEGDVETRVFDYSGYQADEVSDNVWYIVVEGEQQGPYSADQLKGFMEGNSLDVESFVWKEGFDDWLPIRDVPELVENLGVSAHEPVPAVASDAFAAKSFQEPEAPGGPAPSTGGLFDPGPENLAAGGQAERSFDSPFDSGAGIFDNPPDANTSAADVFSSAPSSPTDAGGGLFSEENNQVAEPGGFFGGGAGESGGVDLFAEGGEDLGSNGIFNSQEPAASPRVSAEQAMMTGQRNENSVLFSLSNLQALASSSQVASSASPTEDAGEPVVTNTGGSEGSGLIDIRSLASSLNAESDSTSGAEDDLLSMGGGFAPALGAPVLAPSREGPGKGLIIGLAAGGFVLLAAIVVVLIMFFKVPSGDDQREQEIAALKAQIEKLQQQGSPADSHQMAALQEKLAKKQEEREQAKTEKDEKAVAAGVAGGDKEEAEDKAEKDDDDDHKKRRTRSSARRSSSRRASSSKSSSASSKGSSSGSSSSESSSSSSHSSSSSSRSSSSSSGSSSSHKKESSGKKVAHNELDDLLGSASGGSPKTKKKESTKRKSDSPSSGGAKTTLSRSDVQKGMNSVASRVKACDRGQGGTVTLKVVISRTGSVISASPTGSHAGTSVGNCAARAVRSARFPKSSQNLTVRYPFKL